jgi:hypothetical protein
MRAAKLLLASGIAIFAIFFFDAFTNLDERVDVGGRAALGAFEFFGAVVSLYLLSRGRSGNASLLDWSGCAAALLIASLGFAGTSITLFAFYLFVRDRHDLNTRAAGTVVAAVAVQAVWAPLLFSKLAFLLLQIDAGVVGWLVSHLVPGASWSGTIVNTPSGHDVAITAPCASFHNLSLASLCWVTLSMLHRPYWVKSDIYIGLGAALIQFGFNIWRLVFVCLSLPMYEFWHEGSGKHIFSAVATACAVIFVQVALARRDRRDHKAEIGLTAVS